MTLGNAAYRSVFTDGVAPAEAVAQMYTALTAEAEQYGIIVPTPAPVPTPTLLPEISPTITPPPEGAPPTDVVAPTTVPMPPAPPSGLNGGAPTTSAPTASPVVE